MVRLAYLLAVLARVTLLAQRDWFVLVDNDARRRITDCISHFIGGLAALQTKKTNEKTWSTTQARDEKKK